MFFVDQNDLANKNNSKFCNIGFQSGEKVFRSFLVELSAIFISQAINFPKEPIYFILLYSITNINSVCRPYKPKHK